MIVPGSVPFNILNTFHPLGITIVWVAIGLEVVFTNIELGLCSSVRPGKEDS